MLGLFEKGLVRACYGDVELRGQIVKAYVVLRPGIEPSDELKATLQMHCKRLVAKYKYPREVEFVPELPKTASGKTRHVALRQAAHA